MRLFLKFCLSALFLCLLTACSNDHSTNLVTNKHDDIDTGTYYVGDTLVKIYNSPLANLCKEEYLNGKMVVVDLLYSEGTKEKTELTQDH